jgi:hypothetical protein
MYQAGADPLMKINQYISSTSGFLYSSPILFEPSLILALSLSSSPSSSLILPDSNSSVAIKDRASEEYCFEI